MEQAEIEILVGDLETRIDRLRALYDQYFMGIERLEPMVARKDVERKVQLLRREQIRNTAVRFRFQMLLQRYGTFQQYWHRINRQIEAGTFRRHLLRAKSMLATPGAGHTIPAARGSFDDMGAELEVDVDFHDEESLHTWSPPAGVPAVDDHPTDPEFRAADPVDADDSWSEAETRVRADRIPMPPTPPPAPPTPPPPSLTRTTLRSKVERPAITQAPAPPKRESPPPSIPRPAVPPPPAMTLKTGQNPSVVPGTARSPTELPKPALSQDRLRALYGQLVDAKRRMQESTATLTFDGLAKNLEESSAKLRAKHGRDVDFEVAIRDGKAIIKPVLK